MSETVDIARLTIRIRREGDGYVSSCKELGIVSQGETRLAAAASVQEAVEGFLEIASPSEIERRLMHSQHEKR